MIGINLVFFNKFKLSNWKRNIIPRVLDKLERDKGIKGFKRIFKFKPLSHPSELLRFKAKEFNKSLFWLKKLLKKGDIGFPKNLFFIKKIGRKKNKKIKIE